jgi:hypothetical protein
MRCWFIIIAALAACRPSDGFECGEAFGDEGAFRECTRSREVCICATNSCARREHGGDCTSGYRYVDTPFARKDVAGRCVEQEFLGWRIEQTDAVKGCEAVRDGGAVDAGAITDAMVPDGAAGADTDAAPSMSEVDR